MDNLRDNLVAFYPLSDDANDIGPNSFHGTSGGDTSVAHTYEGYAVRFNLHGNVTLPANFPQAKDSSYTISLWVFLEEAPATTAYIGSGFYLAPDLSVLFTVESEGSPGTKSLTYIDRSEEKLELFTWIHLAAVFDQANRSLKLYMDGEELSFPKDPSAYIGVGSKIIMPPDSMSLGGVPARMPEGIIGCLHDVAFMASAATPDEVKILADVELPEGLVTKRLAPIVFFGFAATAALLGMAAATASMSSREGAEFAAEKVKLEDQDPVCYFWCIISEPETLQVTGQTVSNIKASKDTEYTAKNIRHPLRDESVAPEFEQVCAGDQIAITCHGNSEEIGPKDGKRHGREFTPESLVAKMNELFGSHDPGAKIKVCILACNTTEFANCCNGLPENKHFIFEGQEGKFRFKDDWKPT